MAISPLKAIREKCIDCVCGQIKEVKLCESETCPLWPFRMGKNPYRTKREYTDEQRQEMAERLANAREKRASNGTE